MTPSQSILDYMKSKEGLRLSAYLDTGGILTIGYGHTGHDVLPGSTITQEQADILFAEDVQRKAVQAIEYFIKVPLTQNQFDALVSFEFNTGALKAGETIVSFINRKVAPADVATWWKAHYITDAEGHLEPGLLSRREYEANLFAS
jgi:lysozyme